MKWTFACGWVGMWSAVGRALSRPTGDVLHTRSDRRSPAPTHTGMPAQPVVDPELTHTIMCYKKAPRNEILAFPRSFYQPIYTYLFIILHNDV